MANQGNEKLIYSAGVDFGDAIKDFEKLSNKFRDNRILTEKLRAELSKYKRDLKQLAKSEEVQTAEGKKRYSELIDKINDAEQSLRQAKTTQRELNKEYDKLKLPVNSMARMRAEVAILQKQLDKHVKGISISVEAYEELEEQIASTRLEIINYDQNLNDGRTNVGRYAQSLDGIKSKFDQILGVSVGLGGAISGVFALDSAVSAISDFNEKIRETATEQQAVNIAFEGSKSQLQDYRAEVKGIANTFKTEFNETLNAANQLTSRFGTDADKAIDLVSRGLDNVKDKGGFLGLVNDELRKFVDLGVDDESAIAFLVQSSNLGINPDVFAEPLIKLREATPPTTDALEAAFGKKKTNEIFETFKKSPIEAIQLISTEMSGLDTRTTEYGALLADVFSSSGEDDVAVAQALSQISSELGGVSERTQHALDLQTEYERAMSKLSDELIGTSDSFKDLQLKVQVLLAQGLLAFFNIIKSTPKFISENKVTIIALLVALAAFNFELVKSNTLLLRDAAARKLQTVWNTRATAQQWLLNAAINANPMAIVIGLVAGLVAGLSYLYNNSERVRNGIDNLTQRFLNFYENNLLVKTALFAVIEPLRIIITVFRGAINGGEAFQASISLVVTSIREQFTRLGLSARRLGNQLRLNLTINADKRNEIKANIQSIEKEFEDSSKRVQLAQAKLEKSIADRKASKTTNEISSTTNDTTTGVPRSSQSFQRGSVGNSKQKAEEAARKAADAQKKIEDLQVSLIKDGTERRIAELKLRADREIASIEVSGTKKTELEKLIRSQLANDISKVEADAQKKKLEDQLKLDADDQKKADEALKQRLASVELAFEQEKTLLSEKLAAEQIAQNEFEESLLSAQITYTERRLEAARVGSKEEATLRQELSNLIVEQDKRAKEASIQLVDDYYNEQEVKRIKAFEAEKIALQSEYLNGQIAYEEYQTRLQEMEEIHQQAQLEARAAHIRQLMELEVAGSENHNQLLSQLQDVESESYNLRLEQYRRFEQEKTRVSDEQNQNRLAVAKAGIDFLSNLNDALLQAELTRAEDNEAAQKKAQRKAAARGKVLSVTQATINTFEAATKAMASAPPPFGQILAGLAVAAGLAQVAKIVSTPLPKLARGGYFPNYRPHSQGGTIVEMAKYEMAVTPNAGKNRKARSLTSYINSRFGGVSYPMTDILPPMLKESVDSYLGGVKLPDSTRRAVGSFMSGYSVPIPKMQQGGFNDGTIANQTANVNRSVNDTANQQMELLRQQNQLLTGILQKEGKISIDELGQAAKRQNTYEKFGRV